MRLLGKLGSMRIKNGKTKKLNLPLQISRVEAYHIRNFTIFNMLLILHILEQKEMEAICNNFI